MRLMLSFIKEYIEAEYGINFITKYIEPNSYEKYEELFYKNGKKEYEIQVDWAYQGKERQYCWSVYANFMDYKEWHGFGGAYLDEGSKTIDYIMSDLWGFKKREKQISLF